MAGHGWPFSADIAEVGPTANHGHPWLSIAGYFWPKLPKLSMAGHFQPKGQVMAGHSRFWVSLDMLVTKRLLELYIRHVSDLDSHCKRSIPGFTMLDYIGGAMACAERERWPRLGLSTTRRALNQLALRYNDAKIQCLTCFICCF